MFEHLSGFVDKVNKDFERKQINRIKERLKSSTTEDEEFEINELSSPTIKKIIDLENLKEQNYQSLLFNLRNHFFYNGCFVLFCHGGHFASCYFEKNKKDKQINSLEKDSLVPTLHKTFHAYVTRKKQGKRQVAKDQSKRCKSVGSEVRRLQEEHFKLKSRKFLSDWSNVLSKRETIILSQTPGPYNEYTIFNKGGDEFKVNTNSSVVDNEEDEELKIVKSKENKYEEYNDKKYTCPFTKEQTFTIPAVKQINTSQPNHSSCLETRDEILSVWILDEIGLNQLLNNNEEESTTSNQ